MKCLFCWPPFMTYIHHKYSSEAESLRGGRWYQCWIDHCTILFPSLLHVSGSYLYYDITPCPGFFYASPVSVYFYPSFHMDGSWSRTCRHDRVYLYPGYILFNVWTFIIWNLLSCLYCLVNNTVIWGDPPQSNALPFSSVRGFSTPFFPDRGFSLTECVSIPPSLLPLSKSGNCDTSGRSVIYVRAYVGGGNETLYQGWREY